MTTAEIREPLGRPAIFRCSDEERIHVVTVLESGLVDGRLLPEEFERRADAPSAASQSAR